jgi:two-component system chemotaxis response regulator CheY
MPPSRPACSRPGEKGRPVLRRVLVVDDSELLHRLYRFYLRKYQGCEVICVVNGREALDVLSREGAVDLVLLDINMPLMNGLQLLEALRASGRHERLPIIIVSTEGKEEDTLRGLRLGAAAYLVKPFTAPILQRVIEQVVAAPAPGG